MKVVGVILAACVSVLVYTYVVVCKACRCNDVVETSIWYKCLDKLCYA